MPVSIVLHNHRVRLVSRKITLTCGIVRSLLLLLLLLLRSALTKSISKLGPSTVLKNINLGFIVVTLVRSGCLETAVVVVSV